MVGIVISLLVALTVAASAQLLDIQKRVTIGSNFALENVAVSYNAIASDVRLAGFGVYKCGTTTFNFNGTLTTVSDLNSLYITKATSTSTNPNSDSVTLFYGESPSGASYTSVSSLAAGSISTSNYLGQINVGNMVMIQNSTPPAIPTNCSIFNVTAISTGTPSTITATDTSSLLSAATYPATTSVITGLYNLKYVTISIDTNNNLQEVDAISGTTNIIANNIVYLKVYYGLNDGSFKQADNSSGTDWSLAGMTATPANRDLITSMRFFIIARSPVQNKPNATTGICDTTTVAPTSWDTSLTINLANTTTGDWKCYRYTSSDFIVPLKNKVLFDFSHAS